MFHLHRFRKMVTRTQKPQHRKHVIRLCVLLGALLGCACDRTLEWALYGSGKRLDNDLVALDHANRIVVVKGGSGGRQQLASIRDQAKIRDVITLFERYPDSWVIFSGAAGDYLLYVYQDDRMVGLLGLTASSRVRPGEDTLSFGDYFRRAPSSEVAALVYRLGLPWPPP
jgi:hypothetical protein